MPTDLEIARSVTPRPILDVAADLGLSPTDLELYGPVKAKISASALTRILTDQDTKRGKLVIVTAITPTPAGEGKTTVAIGLAQGLNKLGTRAISAIREPSLGPVFGMKGGATGGGRAQVLPMEEINLHFTGDMHAVGAANNLLCALIDNHLMQGNALDLDPQTVASRRAVDMNDRALRGVVTGLGGKSNGIPRETGFLITVATEAMAILCLAESLPDLKARCARIVIGRTRAGNPVTASDLGAQGAMAALLRDALRPNFAQTLEGTAATIHGGPFGNIAHGCSSILGTRLALRLGDVVVTEAGFGSDLGFEKFCDIVAAPRPDLAPDAVVLVATIRALKMHGGIAKTNLNAGNVVAVRRGLPNLARHAANVGQVGVPFVVTINKFASDTQAEIETVLNYCREQNWRVALNDVWGSGGDGARDLGLAVLDALDAPGAFHPIYQPELSLEEKLDALATRVYGADGVRLEPEAKKQLRWLDEHGFGHLPVCVAKTQYSFTDDPTRRGAPTGFTLRVRSLSLSAGAGFIVAFMGDILTMPGLPKHPAALDIDVSDDGEITGLF